MTGRFTISRHVVKMTVYLYIFFFKDTATTENYTPSPPHALTLLTQPNKKKKKKKPPGKGVTKTHQSSLWIHFG